VQFETKEKKQKLSVITPSLNHARFLEDTITSVLKQSFKNFEHIIIDGGSVDASVEILKRYPHIRWISEKDSGYEEAIRKALSMAKGEYIMNCAVTDGYLDTDWFKRCVEVLDADLEVSLVWGFAQWSSENGELGNIIFVPSFHSLPPQKYDFFSYWLKKYFWLPEGNFCVRKEVFDKCFPAFENFPEDRDVWFEFMLNFNTLGYLVYNIPSVAHFGREHNGQRSQKEWERGLTLERRAAYIRKIKRYRWKLLAGTKTHLYRDGKHNLLPVKFSNTALRREYIELFFSHFKESAKKYLSYFLNNLKT
jgi:glycosyltransferase involved in cell wall biosynthesis